MCTKKISQVDPPRPATDHETPPPPTQRDADGLALLGRLADIGIVDKLLPPQAPMNGGYMPLYIIKKLDVCYMYGVLQHSITIVFLLRVKVSD